MIAIIPARGGSKGLPGKNIMPLLGKPLIAYSIEAAKKSKYITEVYVSTDSEEIAKIAIEYGAKCPFLRPSRLASDDALAIDNYINVINRLNFSRLNKIENFIVLQPTSPLRDHLDIDDSIELFHEKNADSVISYTEENHPITWHKYINEENQFVNIFDEKIKNRQNYRTSYFPNGAIFVFKLNIIKQGKYYTDKSYAHIMKRSKSVDIDSLEDFLYAEFLLKRITQNKKRFQ